MWGYIWKVTVFFYEVSFGIWDVGVDCYPTKYTYIHTYICMYVSIDKVSIVEWFILLYRSRQAATSSPSRSAYFIGVIKWYDLVGSEQIWWNTPNVVLGSWMWDSRRYGGATSMLPRCFASYKFMISKSTGRFFTALLAHSNRTGSFERFTRWVDWIKSESILDQVNEHGIIKK